MSMITWVLCNTNTSIDPLVPDGTIAALATTIPFGSLSVETTGCVFPVGHVVRYPRKPLGCTVTFSEYAFAAALGTGNEHAPANGNVRDVPPPMIGPAKGLVPLRVSTTRQGLAG